MKAESIVAETVRLKRWMIQHGEKGEFTGRKGVRISWNTIFKNDELPTIIFLHGKSESYLKYMELFFDFKDLPFNWFMMDHRGMGFSARMTADKTISHIDSFDDYVADVKTFINDIVKKRLDKDNKKLILIAHSMGGAVGTLFMIDNPGVFHEAILSSPMFALRYPGGELFSKMILKMKARFAGKVEYAPFQAGWKKEPFKDNLLTHSPHRYDFWMTMQNDHSELKSGGASINWVLESAKATQRIVKEAKKVKTPITIIQASKDKIVNIAGHNKFASRSMNTTVTLVEDAWHELWFESDYYREKAIGVLRHHLLKYCQ
ncbi:alpha/beta fold hydrolase [bacterium]|nr:alpha/beta fold hydrolase [bacterium]